MNIILTVGGRICTVCLPRSRVTATAEKIDKWKILALQVLLPTVTVSPLYSIFDFHYVVDHDRVSLSSTNANYDKSHTWAQNCVVFMMIVQTECVAVKKLGNSLSHNKFWLNLLLFQRSFRKMEGKCGSTE
ncbi:unnamed protein product [Cylicocyclus nassatus]|uniref:Uncharacterized protein n=1 Tax=Cylicocyclus nassatus TaxID=53992 RepID=A0AA36DQL6_CYLNA|nr:unnamed protein product [Cylicocyclus nassatus]